MDEPEAFEDIYIDEERGPSIPVSNRQFVVPENQNTDSDRRKLLMECKAQQMADIECMLAPIYAGSDIPLAAAAELFLSLVEKVGVTEDTMQIIISIISLLLPPGNKIPTYKVLKKLVSRLGCITWERYPICGGCRLFLFNLDDERKACPECKHERNLADEQEMLYFPLEPQLFRVLEDASLRVYFTSAALQRESRDDRMRTIKDSPFWKRWVLDSGFADFDGGIGMFNVLVCNSSLLISAVYT